MLPDKLGPFFEWGAPARCFSQASTPAQGDPALPCVTLLCLPDWALLLLVQVQELPAELAGARITYKQFQDMALLRRNRHLVTYALDFCAQVSTPAHSTAAAPAWAWPAYDLFDAPRCVPVCPLFHMEHACAQIERPLSKSDFNKLLMKTLKVQLAPAVLDIIFEVFGTDQGLLDGPGFVSVMKARNRVPGYKVRACCWLAGWVGAALQFCMHRCSLCHHAPTTGGL